MRTNRIVVGLIALHFLVPVIAQAEPWAMTGNFVESCSCKPPCPCNFGSDPTHHHCDSNALVEIERGHYGNINLDGISIVLSFRLGEWVKYYVSENASDEQAKAAVDLLESAKLTEGAKILSTQKAGISVENTSKTVKFSVPESTVEIEVMEGLDGKPIKIHNLPSPFLIDYTQYKSIINRHMSENKNFSYSGTNATVARIDARGDSASR